MSNTVLTLAELESFFLAWLAAEVKAGRTRERTLSYYRNWLDRFTLAAGGNRPVVELVALDLERFKTGWHSVQTVQRLFNWATDNGLIAANPFRKVVRPEPGQRQRILQPRELTRLLRASRPELRRILMAMKLTIGRPQELRGLRWCDYREELSAFVITDFKAKRKRRDKARFRVLAVMPRLARMLKRIRGDNERDSQRAIFLSARGRPWTANSLRLAVTRAARKAKLQRVGEENIVPYTLRHTAATQATYNGVRDRLLADIMGHTSTQTTARYQHPEVDHLAEALAQATRRKRRA